MKTNKIFSEQRDNWATPYKFNDYGGERFNKAFDEHTARSAELDAETGLYYYGARYYTPEIGIWLSVDPLSDKYPHQSNYMYCSGRLVNVIDPDGRDEWEFDICGNVVNRIQNDKKDAFHFVDEKGQRVDGKSIEFEKGTVLGEFSIKMGNQSADYFDIDSDINAEALFKFFDSGTNVEWGHAKIGEDCDDANFIGTSHDNKSTSSNVLIFNLGFIMRGADHNHPNDSPISSEGDISAAKKYQSKFPNIEIRNYTKSHGYTKYDKNTIPNAIELPIFEISSPRIK